MVSRGISGGGSRDPWDIDEAESAPPPVLGTKFEEPEVSDVLSESHVVDSGSAEPPGEQPILVCIPAKPVSAEDSRAEVELHYTTGGELALLVYSTPDTLGECCGPYQPWIAVPREEVAGIAQTVEADTVAVDTAIPQQQWHTGEDG